MSRVFTRVEYPHFRQFMDTVATGRIRSRGYETTIYDRQGDIQALVHAPSIDEKGKLHPAAYYVKAASFKSGMPVAA
jgi:hypothetical protein